MGEVLRRMIMVLLALVAFILWGCVSSDTSGASAPLKVNGVKKASYISENAFEHLDGPILRLDHPDTPVPYAQPLEMYLRPNKAKLIDKIKELVHEGNIRRIIIKDKSDHTLIDVPLTVGVLGALVAPQLAAIGAIAAFVTNATIVVEIAEE